MSSTSARRRASIRTGGCLAIVIAALAAPSAAEDAPTHAPLPEAARSPAERETLPAAQDWEPEISRPSGPVYEISQFVVEYREPGSDLPPLERIIPLDVELVRTSFGYTARRDVAGNAHLLIGPPLGGPSAFDASAVADVNQQILAAFHDEGLLGVYVVPHPEDIAIETSEDLRTPDRPALRIQVWVGRIKNVRTVADGDRIRSSWKINNEAHRRIRANSPIQPLAQGREGTTDVLDQDLLEDYLHNLNRHPGRYVEAALSATRDGEGVGLDYQVNESKPWFIYGQASNTGTDLVGNWQQRWGLVHRQLTNRDDVLSFEYSNTGLSDIHAVQLAYESPWFSGERAGWLKRKAEDPGWLKRELVPWWGFDDLFWNGNFRWNRFVADRVDDTDTYVGEEFAGGGGFRYTAWQWGSLFVDITMDFELRNISTLNFTVGGGRADELLFMPTPGFRIERFNAYSSIQAGMRYVPSVLPIEDPAELAKFGRADADAKFATIQWNAGVTHFLEPLLWRRSWRNPNSALSSTLAHELAIWGRGQYGFDYRLIPQSTMAIGGLYTVRGYPQNSASGDSVYAASIEYRFHLPRALPRRRTPSNLPLVGDFRFLPQQAYGRPDWDLIFSGFFDVGSSFRNRVDASLGESNKTLMGTGAGVELRIKNNVTASVNWGVSLKETQDGFGTVLVPAGNHEVYFLFSVLY